MNKFTLDDLHYDEKKDRYYFPGSPVPRPKDEAESVLKVCNFTGELTDSIKSDAFVLVVEKLERIEENQSNIIEAMMFYDMIPQEFQQWAKDVLRANKRNV